MTKEEGKKRVEGICKRKTRGREGRNNSPN